MDSVARKQARIQERLLLRAQRRLNRLMNLMTAFQANAQNSDQDPGEMEDTFTTNMSSFFTKGLMMRSADLITTTPSTQIMEQVTPTTMSLEESHDELCNDIRGRDRVCCNTAVTCFDDLTTTLEDLSSANNDFSLMSACRVVGSELKKDKRCVSNALSRCSGPGRSLMQSRLDNRLDALYDQFYKHCRRNPFIPRTTSTTSQPIPASTTTDAEIGRTTTSTEDPSIVITTNSGNTGTSGSSQTTNHHPSLAGSEAPSEYGAVIAGALTGGVILLVILLIAAILWCRNRRENLGSDSSAGIIFYKPRHVPRPMPENNNKPPLLRQDSDHYAVIDERLVNSNMRPSLPPHLTSAGYINPVGETDSVNYFQPEAYDGPPMATTRGQLSYGAILASNKVNQPSGGASFYHSSPVIDRASFNDSNFHNSETLMSPRRFMSQHRVESNPNSYVSSDPYDDTDQDDYEQPISASSSLRYSELNKNDTPEQVAPSPPINKTKEQLKTQQASAPFSPSSSGSPLSDPEQPIPSPRRIQKGNYNAQDAATNYNDNKPKVTEINKVQLGPRDSVKSETSTKSSHHYFVLEPGSDKMEYENSVSSPKLV